MNTPGNKHNPMKRFRRRPGGNHGNFNSGGPRRPSFASQEQFDRKTRNNAQNALNRHLDLARDALSSGDETRAENHFQHADHYQRVINACDRALGDRQPRTSFDDDQPRPLSSLSESEDQALESPALFDDGPIEDSM
jgi:hypothetical protein